MRNFEMEKIVGMTVEEATAELQKNGFLLRVIEEDGLPLIGTCDYRLDRVNVCVVDNMIKEVQGIG